MYLLAIDDLTLSTVGISVTAPIVVKESRLYDADVRRRQSSNASVMVGSSARPGEWVTIIPCPDTAANDAVITALDGDPSQERRLLFDRGGVNVVGYGVLRRLERINAYDLRAVIEPTSPLVESETPTTTSKTFASPLDQAVLVTVPGNQRTAPVVRVQPTAQRAAPTAAVGWQYRTRWTLTNNSTESLYRYPWRIALGDTTPLTTTKAQADGDDLRVWIGGKEVARTLVTWDTAASYVWVLIPALAPGASLVVEVVYGNVNAVSPPVLAYPDLPPFNLTTSTNAQHVYDVSTIAANAGKGGWYLSSGTSNPTTDQEVPAAWRNILSFENPDNTDDCCNRRVTSYVDSGTKYIGIFNATRARGGAMDLPDEGLADGVTIHNPLGISSVETEIIYENDAMAGSGSNPIGKFVILTRDSGAEVWNVLFSDNSTDNSPVVIATATYTPAAAVKHLAFAVWPYDEDAGEVNQKSKDSRKINCQWDDVLNLNIASTNLAVSQTETEVAIYELATEIRHGGHGSGVANSPYQVLRIGNALSASGVGTPRAAVKLNEFAVVDCDERSAEVWNSGLTARVEDLPVPAVVAWDGHDDDGTTHEYPSPEWLVLRPVTSPLANSVFATDIAGWETHITGTNHTLVREWDGAIGGAAVGSLRHNYSANTGADDSTSYTRAIALIQLSGRTRVQVAAWVRTSNANLMPQLAMSFYDILGNGVLFAVEPEWVPVINTPYRRVLSAAPPASATQFRVILGTMNRAASPGAGSNWFDDIEVDGEDLVVTDVAMGTVDVEVDIVGRYVP